MTPSKATARSVVRPWRYPERDKEAAEADSMEEKTAMAARGREDDEDEDFAEGEATGVS